MLPFGWFLRLYDDELVVPLPIFTRLTSPASSNSYSSTSRHFYTRTILDTDHAVCITRYCLPYIYAIDEFYCLDSTIYRTLSVTIPEYRTTSVKHIYIYTYMESHKTVRRRLYSHRSKRSTSHSQEQWM
jgi:hypothetical protein